MNDEDQLEMLSSVRDLELVRFLLADLHDDLPGKVSRFRHLADLSLALGANGTLFTGGQTTYQAWQEARSSFIQGNYIATVMLCQGLAEHLLASFLEMGERLPPRVSFQETLTRSLMTGIIMESDTDDLKKLMRLRNPLSHFRGINDPSNLTRRMLDTGQMVDDHLRGDASFALSVAVRLLSLPSFRVDR
ncbi:hypothetical protein [Rhizobium leguminosarum]|uniref:hypothetical protein n=1 Tax=Rhizobium leguminosarum TaxID=384 RepID=UPI000378DCB8|nr:hypothetical protein [Rhizobium leguminosarum]